MPERSFKSPDGTLWRVWEVIPDAARQGRTGHLPEELAGGWLCFECAHEKRRMYPLPPEWEAATEAELWLLCRTGVAAPIRTPSPPPLATG